MGFFKKCFPENSSNYDWVKDPFNAPAPNGFNSAEEDQFIDMTSDIETEVHVTEFWLSVERQLPLLRQRAMGILLFLHHVGLASLQVN